MVAPLCLRLDGLCLLAALLLLDGSVSEIKLLDSTGAAGDAFGGGGYPLTGGDGLAADGDLILVGAPLDDVGGSQDVGSALIFRRIGSTWVQETKLSPSTGAAGDLSGCAVALSGDVAVLGAQLADPGTGFHEGSVTVFRWNGANWIEEAVLSGNNGADGDRFGGSVAVSDDVIVVGARNHDVASDTDRGAATVFRWNGVAWIHEAELSAANGAAGDRFGQGVAIEGDVIVVGRYNADIGGNADEGAASVFRWNGMAWIEEAELTAAGGKADDRMGSCVAVSGDVIVVGVPFDDHSNATLNKNAGVAVVYRWNGTSWLQEAELLSPSNIFSDLFGLSVAVNGAVILVGAPFDDPPPGVPQQGSAKLFHWSGSDWIAGQEIIALDEGGVNNVFGSAVALLGETAIIGAPGHDLGGEVDRGALYVYDLSPDAWTDLGGSSVGLYGPLALAGTGTLEGGSAFALTLTVPAPGAPILAWASLSPTSFQAVGGTVHAYPFQLQVAVAPNSIGTMFQKGVWPPGLPPGTQIWFQCLVADGSLPHGLAISNGLLATTP